MFSKLLSTTAVVLATSALVSAQTHSDCNPHKGQKCKDDPAAAESFTVDFTKGQNDFFADLAGTSITYGDNGAVFTINKDTEAPTMASKGYVFFGRVDVVARAAPGAGIISSFVLQSDDLDEIDWEFVGSDGAQGQSNYFSKGDDSTFDRGGFHPVNDPQGTWHTYSIDWTPTKLDWLIDNHVVRTLNYADAKGGSTFPQTPMQIKLGTWVAGKPGAPDGTVQWAGGLANFANAPFISYVKSVTISNNSKGVKGATAYAYGDDSGSMDSIVIKTDGGAVGGGSSGGSSSSSSGPSSSVTKTSSGSSSSPTTMSTVSSNSSAPVTTVTSTTQTSTTGSSSTTTKATTSQTNAPSAAGKAVLSLGTVFAMAAAVFLGNLVL